MTHVLRPMLYKLMPSRFLLLLVLTILIQGCAPDAENGTLAPPATPVRIQEAYLTPRDTTDNVDSPAVWHGPDGEHWLIATAKATHALLVYDAASGASLRRVGGFGSGPGQLARPNGIAVVDSLLLVVERDNARVQVFTLPAFASRGFIGEVILKRPYGLSVFGMGENAYSLYVTDNYEQPDETIPPARDLGERVQQFRFSINGSVEAVPVLAFGDTTGRGVLQVVESIHADAENDRLLIAEEIEGDSHLKVYTMEGAFTGQLIGATFFPHQAEGIALYTCPEGSGYWIATDQADAVSTFHVFNRVTLEHVGSFQGVATKNTDGIALTQRAFGSFPAGAFFAVHDDGNIAAFDWRSIAEVLTLRHDCVH